MRIDQNLKKLFAALMIVINFMVVANTAQAAPPSAYEFKKPPEVSSVSMSPNGRLLAFVRVENQKHCTDYNGQMVEEKKTKCKDKEHVYRSTHKITIFDLEDWGIVKTFPLPNNYYASWLEWANNERLLAAIVRPLTVGEKTGGFSRGHSRIISIPTIGSGYATLFENKQRTRHQNRYLTGVTNLLHSDPDHIIMPANKNGDLDLWKVNVVNGKEERIARGLPATFFWYADNEGKPVMRFDCYSVWCRKIEVHVINYQDNVGKSKDRYQPKWKKIKTFSVKPEDEEKDYAFLPIAPAPGEGKLYVISDDEQDDRRSVKLYDIKNETFETIYSHPNMDVGGALLDTQTGAYAGAWLYEDRLNYYLENPELQKSYDAINTYFKNTQNVKILGFNKKGSKGVVYVSGPNNPGEYHVYDKSKNSVTFLMGRFPDLYDRIPSNTKAVKIKTRDGSTVTAYHTTPNEQVDAKTPLLVMPHGGPEVRDYYDYDANVQYFVARGYQVLQVNFRGSSGYGKAFAKAGYGEWGGLMQTDVIDAVNHLYSNNKATATNICMVGYSYGGYVALYAGGTTPDMFKCIVSGGGVSNLTADLKHSLNNFGKNSESYKYWLKSIGNPNTDKEVLKAKSPINLVDNFKAPVLLIHGQYDDNVTTLQSKKMNQALKKAGKSVEYIRLDDVGHSDWDLENEILYLETIDAFLSKHLTK